MSAIGRLWSSALGKKIVMAVTGLILVGFTVVHMIGNLQVFLGPERINAYGHLLHGPLAEVTWAIRFVLLVSVILHFVAAYQLTRMRQRARPVGYAEQELQTATFASRTIRWGGVLLLVFIVYHLLDMTTGTVHPDFVPGDVYHNLAVGMSRPLVATFYLVAMVALGLHLYHGLWSSPRTLGAAPPTEAPMKRILALALALIVAVGFAIVPLAVLLGLVR